MCLVFTASNSIAQCGAGYTSAQLNWDKISYYYNSGSNVAPFGYSIPSDGNYVTNAMEQTQKFAIGPNYVTIATSAAGIVQGENGTHTGDVDATLYAGDDAKFTPTSDGQTITMTFNTVVENLSFTLYDIDRSQSISLAATDAASVAQNINVVTYASTILTVTGNNTTAPSITASNTSLANNVNTGTATITVSGSVKTFTITIATIGSNAVFWLSDINACVSGTFPLNYNQTGNNQPLQGPAGNQPDYFLITPDNNSVYMVDPATGNAWYLFDDPEKTYVNSMAYDPYNHILYYVSEAYPAGYSNKKLKKYDFNTGTISTVLNDITTALNIPTFNQSLEGAGACFYNGQLYLGVEGGKYDNSNPRESIVFRIDFDASFNPVNICQVFATPSYNTSGAMLHDWADFVIKDGILYNFNSRGGTTMVSYEHFNMMTGASTKYLNPGSTAYAGQAGLDWAGNIYDYFSAGVAKYNGAGGYGAIIPITAITGGPWPGGNGDASENFRPQVDFGDAPSSYDPNPVSPAAHVQDANLRLGTNEDKEWITKGQTTLANSDSYDDALAYANTYNPASGNYLTQASVYNNTGSNATMCAWLDYNGNGVFDASEGISVTVPSSASSQSFYLYWPSISSSLPNGTYTYLRIRITYASNGMTTANPTGYYNSGEVEDYRVPVNVYALSVQQNNFDAKLTNAKAVQLKWTSADESNVSNYTIEKSGNGAGWEAVNFTSPKMNSGITAYEAIDKNPAQGISYYRLKIIGKDGKVTVSNTETIQNNNNKIAISIAPNPAASRSFVYINAATTSTATLEMINEQGAIIYNKKVQLTTGTNSIELPVSTFANGKYIVQIQTNTNTYSQSLIVTR